MEQFFKLFDKVNKYVCATTVVVMALMVFTNTVFRYIFSSSIVSTEEVCRFLFVWGTFLATITVWHENGHIAVSMLTDHLKGKFKKVFVFLSNFITIFAFVAMIIGCYEYMDMNSYYAQITGITYGVMIFPIMLSAIMCLLMTLHSMFNMLRDKD